VDITMPQLGETVTEGTVTRWLKQVGDQVAPDELIFEVSTDKVDSEVPAPSGGYLVEILVPEGETVPVGTRLAVLGDAPPAGGGGGGGAAAAAPAEAPASAPAEPEAPAPAAPATVEAVETVAAPVPEAASAGGGATGGSEADEPAGARAEAAAASREAADKGIATGAAAGTAGRGGPGGGGAPAGPGEDMVDAGPERGNGHGAGAGMLLSPVVRRLVAENNLDPSQIPGTGEGGRVTRSDVLAYLDRQGGARQAAPAAGGAAPAGAPAAPTAPAPAPAAAAPSAPAPAPTAPAEPAPAPAPAAAAAGPAVRAGGDEVVPFDNMRRRTAEHMVRSKHTSPHVLTAVEVDFHAVERARSNHRSEWKDHEGFTLTYLPFVARAVCDALAEFPHLNASVGEDQLTVHHYVNLGIAVDLDQRGLIVPVVKGAEGKRLRQLSREIRDLAERARGKKLTPDDVTGGTFTITNPGPYGTLISAPIINQPQVAILATEGIKKKPVVVETPAGDSIAIHPVGIIALSWDHRAIDGAYASKFLHAIRTIIETRDWEAELA